MFRCGLGGTNWGGGFYSVDRVIVGLDMLTGDPTIKTHLWEQEVPFYLIVEWFPNIPYIESIHVYSRHPGHLPPTFQIRLPLSNLSS